MRFIHNTGLVRFLMGLTGVRKQLVSFLAKSLMIVEASHGIAPGMDSSRRNSFEKPNKSRRQITKYRFYVRPNEMLWDTRG